MLKFLALFHIYFILNAPVMAGSAEAWKSYQEGRNPVLEVGLLVIGTIIFFSVLIWLNKWVERKQKSAAKKSIKKSKKRNSQ